MQQEKINTTPKNNHIFEINKAFIIVCKLLSKEHSGAKEVMGMLNPHPLISKSNWPKYVKNLPNVFGELMDHNLKKEAINGKLLRQSNNLSKSESLKDV